MSKTPATEVAINEAAIDLFEEMLEMDDILKAIVKETKLGPVILDLGVNTQGGFLAGEYVTQVCMGGLAEVSISLKSYSKEFA
ncbi:MAG: methenyltetrahydromethanopterin cyclohydrolase, partial [Candidatus Heimdallarchaeota archaeon]